MLAIHWSEKWNCEGDDWGGILGAQMAVSSEGDGGGAVREAEDAEEEGSGIWKRGEGFVKSTSSLPTPLLGVGEASCP